MELSKETKKLLLRIARESINSVFTNKKLPDVDFNKYSELRTKAGAFVTLHIKDQLRGCIGYIVSDIPLYDTICDSAKQAAFKDPRFLPLSEDELEKIEIEISVLSPPEPIDSYDEIKIGKHGLILTDNGYRGVLLPQVATEHNFNREQFLSAICEKSGLPGNYWQQNQISLQIFTASIFSEKDLR